MEPVAVVRAEVVKALLEPLQRVLRDYIGLRPAVGALQLISDLPPAPCVSVSIELKGGRIAGPITWDFEPAMASVVAGRMLDQSCYPSYDSVECADAVAELANLIVGNATGALADAGYEVDVFPPTARVRRTDVALAEQALAINVRTEEGELLVMIDVRLLTEEQAA